MRQLTSGLLLALCFSAPSVLGAEAATGPLRALSSNPRWFADGSGHAVLLAGSHAWWVLQDNGLLRHGGGDPPPAFDYDGFLDFLESHDHNLTDATGSCTGEWLNVATGDTSEARSVSGGGRRAFSTPFGGPAVLHLRCE
jgi:hypothetical protein